MVHRENLFDGDIVAGIISALIVMILFSIYAIISPTSATTRRRVFQPYPTISPKDIPDAPVGNQKCFTEKTLCDKAGPANQCAKLCGKLDNSFSCTQPGGPGRIPTFYNGMKLNPENHYCLPKAETSFNNEDASSTINPNTGVWEWVTDPDYCATVGDQAVGNQCWKPRCLYPSLFANEDGGCNDFIGCRPSEGGPVQSSLKLTLAGATELFPSSPENAMNAVGLLFDPIRTWSTTPGSTRGIEDDVIKYTKGERIITSNVISPGNYQALISEGPHKTTSNGEPYWACACNDRFSTDADDAQGVCSIQQNVPWGICESHADQKSCEGEENSPCTFHHPTRIFRPPDDSKSCQTDFCASESKNYQSGFIPYIRTPNLFSKSSPPSPGEPEFPYCVCGSSTSGTVEECQTDYNATQTIIPYGRRKGLMGRNPCIGRTNEGENENKIYLIKSKGGVVKSMSDFSSPDSDYDIQCCNSNLLPGTKLDENNCDPDTADLFYRYCLSRNHTGNPGPGGVCLSGTKQQDSCIISDPKTGNGYCASTLGNGGHVIKGKSKPCNSKEPCADVCYTEITSGKVYDPKTKQNSRWENAHNCDLGTSNDLGIESVLPCEANHCQANCYKEGAGQCVNIYSSKSSPGPATVCSKFTKQTACDQYPDDCRYIKNFATACNKIEEGTECSKGEKEGEFCTIDNQPRSGTCMYRTEGGRPVLKCVNCSCKETLVTSPVCAGTDASGDEKCQNDNDCAGQYYPPETVPGFGSEIYNVQDKFCDMTTLDSDGKGVCKTWGTCTVNLDVNSGYKAPGPGAETPICLRGKNPDESCNTIDDCRPCHFCAKGTCVDPADPTLADCDTLSGPACSKENNCKLKGDGTCVYLVEPDPNMVCIKDSSKYGYRCNTNRALALYPGTSWMDENAARGSTETHTISGAGPVTTESIDNRIKPSSVKGNDKFRCRNDQGCLGFAPQKNASELPKSVELTYTNHPKAALITPYGGNGAWLSSGGSTAADGPLAPKVCNTDDDCSGGGSCRLLNPGQPEQGICISPNFSGWDGDPGSTYMEPSFWDGTGGNNWALQLTTCGSKDDNCPPDLSWCSKGGLDGYPNVRKFGCSLTGGLLGDYQCTNGIMTSPDGDTVVDPSVIIKDPLTGKIIKNDKEAAAACVTYYSEKCFPGIKMDANEQPIPQVLSFKPTRDGSKGLMNVTPCLVDGTLIGATVGSDPFWNTQIGFDKTWGRDPSGKSTGADVNSLFIANEVPCCSNNNNETNQRNFQEGSQGGCIGGSTVIETKRGKVNVSDLKVGDFVKTRKGWSKVFYIRNHGFSKIQHLKFIFEGGEEFTITEDHLVFDASNNLKRADKLKIGENIWGSSKKIMKITHILDIPLTPCVVEGEIFVNEFLISCWAQSKENAEKMMQLMKIVEKFMGDMNEKELELLSHSFYEKFKASGKNMDVLVN